ncbi:hypothetical protein CH63R_01339 [Colletotrichum higginsianum IMI 349063]|uniref:Uncharacterized protein n=1 Tax=Colletotrichum higginsianum (strain IMI 349063) TaxID=759273 RepID=A0A1B7YVT9_COLHI|nr:hypothetical protein CH63R_01339 [Colletotrichum higginsianum IMI 349063]OBR16159.1 hypothetical protein CH63R_01339 [Colletotrichum higginsianum IMI 349063]
MVSSSFTAWSAIRMSPVDPIQAFLFLAKHSSLDIHFSITTPYGLVIELPSRIHLTDKKLLSVPQTRSQVPAAIAITAPGTTSEPRLKLNVGQGPEAESSAQQRHQEKPCQTGNRLEPQLPLPPGYKYYISPDFGTNFIWYDWGWPGNPEGGVDVPDDELEERYSTSWCNAYAHWVERYTKAFEAQGCHLGAGNEVFPDLEERHARNIEGALLAAWLALQDGVHQVQHGPRNDDNYQFVFEREGVEATLGQFIQSVKRVENLLHDSAEHREGPVLK